MSAPRGGRVHVVRGDIRRLACSAWAVPGDGQGRLEPTWLAWPPGAANHVQPPDPFPHWTVEARRVQRLAGWPANLPQPWLLHVELDPTVPRSWLVEAVLDFVEAAAGAGLAPPPGRQAPLLAVPLGVAGIGSAEGRAARRAAGGLALELLPELREAARQHRVDVALVAHSDDSHAAGLAACLALQADAEGPSPRLLEGLGPVVDACRRGNLAALVGPELARRQGVPAWEQLLDHVARDSALPEAWRQALSLADPTERSQAIARHVGGPGPLGRMAVERLARAQAGLAEHLLAGLRPDPVLALGPDDLLEQAWASAGRPLDVLLDGPPTPGGPRLFKRRGSVRRPRTMVEAQLDRSRRRERDEALKVAAQACLGPEAHLLVLGFRPDGDLLELLSALVPLLPHEPGAPPRITVLVEDDDATFTDLWPADQVRWLPLVERTGPRPADAAVAAEQVGLALERVLEHLGLQRGLADRGLDPGLRPLLPDGDQALGRAVDELIQRLPARARQAALWPALRHWLQARGLEE